VRLGSGCCFSEEDFVDGGEEFSIALQQGVAEADEVEVGAGGGAGFFEGADAVGFVAGAGPLGEAEECGGGGAADAAAAVAEEDAAGVAVGLGEVEDGAGVVEGGWGAGPAVGGSGLESHAAVVLCDGVGGVSHDDVVEVEVEAREGGFDGVFVGAADGDEGADEWGVGGLEEHGGFGEAEREDGGEGGHWFLSFPAAILGIFRG